MKVFLQLLCDCIDSFTKTMLKPTQVNVFILYKNKIDFEYCILVFIMLLHDSKQIKKKKILKVQTKDIKQKIVATIISGVQPTFLLS